MAYPLNPSQVYIRLDQPLASLEVYRSAVDRFPGDVCLLTGMARIYEAIGNMAMSRKYYITILQVSFSINVSRHLLLKHFGSGVDKERLLYNIELLKEIVSQEEPINVEAIACVGMNHFYADQPELSLRFYRRLLQMGVSNSELYNNLGLCCFYAQVRGCNLFICVVFFCKQALISYLFVSILTELTLISFGFS